MFNKVDVAKLSIIYLQSGFIASLPYLVMLISSNVFSYFADYLRAKKYLTTNQARKIFNTIGELLTSSLDF